MVFTSTVYGKKVPSEKVHLSIFTVILIKIINYRTIKKKERKATAKVLSDKRLVLKYHMQSKVS